MKSGMELKIQRIIKNIKATDIAKHLGLSKSYISLMESGNRTIPNNTYEQWIKFLK